MKKSNGRNKSLFSILAIISLLLAGTLLAQNNSPLFSIFTGNYASPTPTPQTVRPKRKTTKTETENRNEQSTPNEQNSANLSQILASADFNLIGLVGTVNPATQTVPKNIPTAVLTSVQVPEGTDTAPIIAQLNPNYRIRGELSGPSFTSPRVVEARIGQPIQIPPMPNVGDHVLQNLRIVDSTDTTNTTLAPVTPDSVGITVIDNILVTQVQVTEMTYEQIVQSGINLNNSNYNFFNFVIGLGTSSGTVPITIPVALPNTTGNPPVVGNPTGGVTVNGVSVPLPDIVPVMLAGVDEEGNPTPIEMPGGGQMQIPGVVVFPGRIGLLHQFFEAIVIVANGAPNGTPLVITNLRARANLPNAGTPNDPSDDPLRIAATQQGGVQSQLEIHGLGPDGRYGTADDTMSFNPGQSGQAAFLLEGLREGLHTVDFDLEGTLQGLPSGNVTIRGSVPGAVLVRDAEFGVTFTHPSVVRAGQEYDLGLTVFNSGNRNLNGISLNLLANSVSGATLIDSETKMLNQTIPPGSSGTVKWRLRSNTTGQVTASYVKVGDGIDAGLNLVTGVGDRNVPLSPDSLILPEPVRHLPTEVVEAARQMLGQSWSVATAPAGSLPAGVLPIDKQTVVNKAIELGWAGLRINFHEDRDTSLRTLMRDWIGETQANSSAGFADALRNTPAGFYFFDTVGTKFFETVPTISPADFHKKLVAAESSRSSFVSAYVSQTGGQQIFGAKINSPTNQSVGFGANPAQRFGDLRTGASLNLLELDPHSATNTTKGNLLLVSKPTTTGNWSLEINGWASGNADVSILAPTSGKNYRQLIFPNVAMTAGKRYRISFRASGTTAPVVEEFINGAFRAATLPFTISDAVDPNPEVTGVVQIAEDVIEGGDKFGRLVGVLFSKPMVKNSVETITRYQIGGGTLVSDPTQTVGKLIRPTGASQNFGGRFSILALDSPVGPYIKRTLTANGIVDASGKIVSNSTGDIEMRVSPQGNPPGGYLTGRVMQADGTAVPNAGIFYRRMKASPLNPTAPCGMLADWETVSYQRADANGEFTIDYVREGDCHPVTVLFQNTATNSEKTLVSNVAYNGQHLIFNAVFLARGNVQGTVTSGGVPLANANVSIISELDPLNNKLVRTNAQGFYSAASVPVGGITVKAVGTGAYSLSSGIAAGNLSEAGATATINVTTQNVSGRISGRVLDSGGGQTPVPNSLVVAKANIPGFPSQNGPIPVGYAFTGQDGSFTIDRLPIGNIYLEATDPARGVSTSATVQLTPQNTQVEGVILLVSNGFGRVLGKVVNELGQIVPNAVVQEGAQAVQADASGNYILPRTREGNVSISAIDPVTLQRGSTEVSVRRNEDTTGADIVIRRPANLNGQVFINQNGTNTPLAQAYVSADGQRIVRTDAQGRYTLNGVPSGTNLTIRFVHPQGRLFVNTDVYLNPGETLSRNAVFQGSSRIHGRITQPDGVTPVVTGVALTTVKPHLNQDIYFGLPEEVTLTYQTTTNGLYAFENLNPTNYRVSSSNVFFPVTVSQSGILPPNADVEINLSLVDTLAGRIHGRIYQPDGVTPVGANVRVSLGGGSLADVTVRTDSGGNYEFAEVFAAGGYTLTATDPATNRTNRTGVSIQRNQDIAVDLRLLGRGNLRVRVLDGGGSPLQTGSIRVEGSNYPNDQRYIELTPSNNGEFEFANLTEGNYAVSALYNGLGGRVSGTVTIGGTTVVTVQVQAVGRVTGRVFMPGGTSPVGLADVTLMQNGRIIGLITTQDSEEERGKFEFGYVPTGDFTIDVFDNRSGRRGRSAGTITTQGQVANVNVNLLALGTVIGQVTSNGVPAEHALVNLSADGSGISGTSRVATTDASGNFRFPGIPVGQVYVSVTNGPGGLTGQSQGIVSGTNEPLPDTVINVALTPTATVAGTVYRFGGSETFSGALVRVTSNNFSVNTTTDEAGRYRVNFVPLGTINVKVESPFGYDRGKSLPIVSNQAGASLTADVTMSGTGSINGTALGSNGTPLTFGRVTFTNTAWGEHITVVAPVQSNGTYSMNGLPTGDFNLKLTVPEIVGVGTATDILAGGQTLVKNLQLENAGKIFGSVIATDGTTPSVGADVTLSLAKQGGGYYTFITHTDSSGNWMIDNLPLGTISVRISDVNSGGVANISGLILNTNGQQLDAGSVTLDNTPISVVSVTPANNATNVAINSTVNIVFSEPVDANTIHSGSLRLNQGNNSINASRTISPDGTTVTLTPNPVLAETQTFTVVITTFVKDRNGIALVQDFNSTFTTADQTPPTVSAIVPANGSSEILLNSKVTLTASEALDSAQDLSNLIQLSTNNVAVSGTTTLDQTGRILEFTPSTNLTDSSIYNVTVNGLKDSAGNTQTTAFNSTFRTKDLTAPVVNPLPIDGTSVRNFTPTITATYADNFSGINTSSVVLTIDGTTVSSGVSVTGGGLSYTPTAPLAAGNHNVTVQIADNAGNLSQLRTASFTIDNSGPIISSFTIGGVPAVNGAQISSSLTPLFEINYTDDTGINQATTRLLLGYNGATPAEVSVTVTNTKLTYQPTSPMADGNYVVRAIITNNLGTSTDTGQINFTVDVDAPDIQTVTPNHGNQHGGTSVTLAGLRLLNSNATAPTVSIGNNPATVVSATPGTGGNPDTVIITTPAGVPGNNTIEVTTDRGIGRSIDGFIYDADAKTPFTAESDTLLLWHLNETANGTISVADSGSLGLHGTAENSNATVGRFANGRTAGGYWIYSQNYTPLFSFGSSNFTMEGWFKMPQGTSARNLMKLYNNGYGDICWVNVNADGSLTATVKSSSGSSFDWNLTMPGTVYDFDNNQWHQINLVVNQTTNAMKLYVDGVERASATKPANFGQMYASGTGYHNRLYVGMNTNSVVDEIRVSSSAHSAQQVLTSYLGAEGGLVLDVFNNSLLTFARGTTTNFSLEGYGLAGVVSTANDSAGNPVQIQTVNSSATVANLSITIGENAALGESQITLSSQYGTKQLPFRIVDLSRVVYSVELDTVLLWHLDETGNGTVNIADSGSLGLHGTAENSNAVAGRFANGRTAGGYWIYSQNYTPLFSFGSSNFTMEGWFKMPQGTSARNLMKLYNNGYGDICWVNVNADGSLTATVKSSSGSSFDWNLTMPGTVYDFDNNQWHQIALTVDQIGNQLKLYVDGVERASATKPANFGQMYASGTGYHNRLYVGMNTNSVVDEIRVSSSAHSAQQINQNYIGQSDMRVTSVSNYEIFRNSQDVNPVSNQIVLNGHNLEGITSEVLKDGQPIAVSSSVGNSTYSQATINLLVSPNAPLGIVQLRISKPNQTTAVINLRLVEANQLETDIDTLLLWHLDETANGTVNITDSGQLGLHGIAENSNAIAGRFANGRTAGGYWIYSQNYTPLFSFGTSNFTMEGWFKMPQGTSARNLMKLYNNGYGDISWVNVNPNGSLTATVKSSSGSSFDWNLTTSTTPDPQTGYWLTRMDDNYWHHVALTVDQTGNQLKLYVDGVERASATKPTNFGQLYATGTGYHNRLYVAMNPNSIVDEIRVSSTALSPERIRQSVFGNDVFRLTRTYPKIIQKGITNNEVIILGYGMNNVSVSTNNPDVTATISSATISKLNLSVNASSTAQLGDTTLTLTNSLGQTLNTQLTVVDQKAFDNTQTGTILLWHLNETSNGTVSITDSGSLGLHGTAENSNAVAGRFANGRTAGGYWIYSQNYTPLLSFGSSNFTMEGWFKMPQGTSARNLMKLYNNGYGDICWVNVNADGSLTATVKSSSGSSFDWSLATSMIPDPQTGYWLTRMDDNYWHYVVLTVDQTGNQLKLYVDGVERASATKPTNFGQLYATGTGYHNRFYVAMNPNSIVDEIRILNFPRTAQQIADTWFGTNNGFSQLIPNIQNKSGVKSNPPNYPRKFPVFGDEQIMPVPQNMRPTVNDRKEERK